MQPDMIGYIVDFFSKDLALSLFPLTSSYDNLVLTDGAKVVVRISITKTKEDVFAEADFIRFLSQHDFPAATIIGEGVVEVDKVVYPYIIFDYISHEEVCQPAQVNTYEIMAAASQLAHLHDISKRYLASRPFIQARTLEQELNNMHIVLKREPDKYAVQLKNDVKWALGFLSDQTDQKNKTNEKQIIIHNDYRMQNVLFKNRSELAAIIDFDYSLSSFFWQKDVAHAALEWSFADGADEIDKTIFELFIESYAKAMQNKIDIDTKKFITQHKLIDWAKFSALSDAAGYFLSLAEDERENFNSYMYGKYKYLEREYA